MPDHCAAANLDLSGGVDVAVGIGLGGAECRAVMALGLHVTLKFDPVASRLTLPALILAFCPTIELVALPLAPAVHSLLTPLKPPPLTTLPETVVVS